MSNSPRPLPRTRPDGGTRFPLPRRNRKGPVVLKAKRPSPPPAPFSKPKRSPLWLFIWVVLAFGLIGNLSIVGYLFLGMISK